MPGVATFSPLANLIGPGHRLELGGVEHGLDLRPIQADLAHAALQDLQRRVREGARPAVRLLLVLLHVGVEVLLGPRELHLGVPARDAHHALRALEAVAVERERGAHPGEEDGRVPVHLLGLGGDQDIVRRIGQPHEGVGARVLEAAEHRGEILGAQRIALGVHHLEAGRLEGGAGGGVQLDAEEIVDVGHRDLLDLALVAQVLQQGGHRLHLRRGLHQHRVEVGQGQLLELPGDGGGADHRVAVLAGHRRDREVHRRAPRGQQQVHLVVGGQLLVEAHRGLDLAAVVDGDELDHPAPLALHREAALGVDLLLPQRVVRDLGDAGAHRVGAGRRHGVADADRLRLGAGARPQEGNRGRARRRSHRVVRNRRLFMVMIMASSPLGMLRRDTPREPGHRARPPRAGPRR